MVRPNRTTDTITATGVAAWAGIPGMARFSARAKASISTRRNTASTRGVRIPRIHHRAATPATTARKTTALRIVVPVEDSIM